MDYRLLALDAPDLSWPRLVRDVERSGQPLWLEADGEIRGVLLPTAEARRLFGRYISQNVEELPLPSSDQNKL